MIKVEPGLALAVLTAYGSNCAKNAFWKPLLPAV